MVIGVDQSDDKDIVITGSKDHYIKVTEFSFLPKQYTNSNFSTES